MYAAVNPMTDGFVMTANPGDPPTDSNGGATMGAVNGPNLTGTDVASIQGTSPLTGAHNTPLHVAAIGLVCLMIIIGLRKGGFSFSWAGKLGR